MPKEIVVSPRIQIKDTFTQSPRQALRADHVRHARLRVKVLGLLLTTDQLTVTIQQANTREESAFATAPVTPVEISGAGLAAFTDSVDEVTQPFSIASRYMRLVMTPSAATATDLVMTTEVSLVVDEGDVESPRWIPNREGVRKAQSGELLHVEPARQIVDTYAQSPRDATDTTEVETASLQVWQEGLAGSQELRVTVEVANENDEAEYVSSTNRALVLDGGDTTKQQSVSLTGKYARLKFTPNFSAASFPINIRATMFFKER